MAEVVGLERPLQPWLEALGLGHYWPAFEHVGCEMIEDLEEFEGDDSLPSECAMKHFDRARLLRFKPGATSQPPTDYGALLGESGGQPPPLGAGPGIHRLHNEFGLLVCDLPYVTRDVLQGLSFSAAECDSTLLAIASLSGSPLNSGVYDNDTEDGQNVVSSDGTGSDLSRTKSAPAMAEFQEWLKAIHLEKYFPVLKEQGLDIIEDLVELADDASTLDEFGLKPFEQARLLRAADFAGGPETSALARAQAVGGGGDSGGAGGAALQRWLASNGLSKLVEALTVGGGLHVCDLPYVTGAELSAVGVPAAAHASFLAAASPPRPSSLDSEFVDYGVAAPIREVASVLTSTQPAFATPRTGACIDNPTCAHSLCT